MQKAKAILQLTIKGFLGKEVGKRSAGLTYYLVFAIFPLLLWRRRSDATTAADNHRLPPQPLQEDQVLHGRAAARRMRRRPGAAGTASSSSTSSPLQYSGLENSMDCIVHGLQRVRHD